MIDEKILLSKAKIYLENARPGDLGHTIRVVRLVKEILKTEKGNPDILIPAAYLHEIGYSGLFKKGQKLNKTNWHSKQDEHMQKGKVIAIEILSKLKFSEDSIQRISWMVSVHDDWYNQNDHELGILMDADNLSKLNIDHIRNKFENPKDIIELWEKDMPKRLKTKTGKAMYSKVMRSIKKEFNV